MWVSFYLYVRKDALRTFALRQCSGICDPVEEPEKTVIGQADLVTDRDLWVRQSGKHATLLPSILVQCICLHRADCGSVSLSDRKLLEEETIHADTGNRTQATKFSTLWRSETTVRKVLWGTSSANCSFPWQATEASTGDSLF